MGLYRKVLVGIFSRESESTYRWVTDLLTSPQFQPLVEDVRLVQVSNTMCGHSTQLGEEIAKCQFAILYHTNNRGRLNITNVTDSLYDEELRHLSQKLGRERIIVLVDDVNSDDPLVNSRLLNDQPLINELSRLLIVMYKDEKSLYDQSGGGWRSDIGSYQQGAKIQSKEKIQKMKSQISNAQELNT
ncbi:uncharacterized protein [Hyperolius riggenbachi]